MRGVLVVCLCLATTPAAARELRVYRARHRPAAELAPLAESAMAGAGRVAVDARTASLVLTGPPEAIDRALALLEELDRALRTVRLDYRLEAESELRAAGIEVDWSGSVGPLRVGRVPSDGEGLRVRARADQGRTRERFRGTLRVLEGEPGWIAVGESRVIPLAGAELRAESGFEALPTILEGDRVRVELRPFDGRFDAGGVRYTAAATALEVAPGETIVVAETSREAESRAFALPGGAAEERASEERLLLLTVELER